MSNVVDTSLTKVFVGGLAWETPREAITNHFQQYGDISETVIISDKLTGRSKGYGFVTFKDAEAAKKACEDSGHVINGRRVNCNLASLGVRRPKPLPYNFPPQQNGNIIPRANSAAPANHVQWYYPAARAPASPFNNHQPVPFYGYSPTYMTYNQKLSHTGGSYMNRHFSPQVYPGQPLMPMYPMVYPNFHQSHTMGLPPHVYSPSIPRQIPSMPALIS